ncbi:hypothetical protein CRG98_000713 [Punica granatum]|uniref:Uncharacterized protein n=1 Tax=Punica granatum TaxID=22663 RepID=A0A2I0LDV1_PUNGR|nr:hypothetical protein CRG98_000713 [Punica granatum]
MPTSRVTFQWSQMPLGKSSASKTFGSRDPPPGAPNFYSVPFLPTTSASCAITFKGFLITPTLPREEVVMVREPFNRAQPPFHFLLLIGPRSPTLHRAAVGVVVPTPFSLSCHGRCLSGTYCPLRPAGSLDPLATSPTLFLERRG